MAACKLGCKGHTMASASYNAEVKNIETFLRLQRPAMADEPVAVTTDASQEPVEPADFLAAKYLKKNKTKQVGLQSKCWYVYMLINHSCDCIDLVFSCVSHMLPSKCNSRNGYINYSLFHLLICLLTALDRLLTQVLKVERQSRRNMCPCSDR